MRAAIFTGAGVSAQAPASLPQGNSVRDDILTICRERTRSVVGDSSDLDVGPLDKLPWKLEYVVGRLEGIVGSHAADVLLALDITVPNRTHLLLSLHLARGGRQATLNFDQGIELAYDLLTGRASAATPESAAALEKWRALTPVTQPLRVLATEKEFQRWSRAPHGDRPTLAKLHGTLRKGGAGALRVTEAVITDEPELAQLSQARIAALTWLNSSEAVDTVLITGYSGEDIDVYEPLLQLSARRGSMWAAPSLPDMVQHKLADQPGVSIEVGRQNPAAYADHQIAALLGLDPATLPTWPEEPTSNQYSERFSKWAQGINELDGAEAYAWMLADAERRDAAIRVLRAVLARRGIAGRGWTRTSVRLADALGDRADLSAKQEAAALFMAVVRRGNWGHGYRTYSLIRWGEQQRNLVSPLRGAILCVVSATLGLLLSFPDRAGADGRARATSAIAHMMLRMVDARFSWHQTVASRVGLRFIATVGAVAAAHGMRNASGNRSTFIAQQRVELAAYRCLLGGAPPVADASDQLIDLGNRYRRMPDQRGQGNVACAKAVLSAARGDRASIGPLLDDALHFYTRHDGTVYPSGQRLVEMRRRNLLG